MNGTRSSEKSGSKNLRKRETWRARLQEWIAFLKPHTAYMVTLAVAGLFIYLLIRPPAAHDLKHFQLNQPSPRVVNAPFEFQYIDEISTELQRQEKERLIAPVYTSNPEPFQVMQQEIQALADASSSTPRTDDAGGQIPPQQWVQEVLNRAGFTLDERPYTSETGEAIETTYSIFYRLAGRPSFWSNLIESIHEARGQGIADTIEPLVSPVSPAPQSAQRAQTGVTIISPDGMERVSLLRGEIINFDGFLSRLVDLMSMRETPDSAPWRAQLIRDLVEAAFAGPSLIYNESMTNTRRQEARNTVSPIQVYIQKNETILGRDQIVTALDLQALEALRDHMHISPNAEFGYVLLAGIFIFVILKYLQSYYPAIASDWQKIAVLFTGMILLFALTRVVEHLSFLDQGRNTLSTVGYAIPTGAVGVIFTLLASARLAAFCCALMSLYVGIILGGGTDMAATPYTLVSFITACSAIYTVTRIRQRSDLYRAGGITILMAQLVILAIELQTYETMELLLSNTDSLKYALIWGVVNGVLVSMLSIALLPLFEEFFGKITDIRLLELSQKNEVLHKLEHEAPGTYQHTMRVATLAESAAESIGANALLTRVGTYYHDIGKTDSPSYFVENQHTSAEKAKHSKLTPNMSCMIIRNHVKKGLDLGKKYKLPKAILDFIPEHHGTTLMAYFYHQALGNEENEGKVKEEDYRYPGPKPQSKETAILMLADSLEATSRLLDNPSERDVRQLVRKIINERFMDGQFDECDLTLKDLHTLFQSFSESIMHTMHQRIHYPAPPASHSKPETEDPPETIHDDTEVQEVTEPVVAIKENRHPAKPTEEEKTSASADKSNG